MIGQARNRDSTELVEVKRVLGRSARAGDDVRAWLLVILPGAGADCYTAAWAGAVRIVGMNVVIVSVSVVAGKEEAFLAATLENARNTRKEAGNLRFDVIRGEEAGTFVLYEVYRDAEGHKAHQETAHYLVWKGAVEGMMARPRTRVKGEAVWFGEGPPAARE